MALWLVFGCLPAQARPKAVLFLCSAPSLQDIQDANTPHLKALMRDGGVGVMTVGLSDTDRLRTLSHDGYVPMVTVPDAVIANMSLVHALRGHGGLAYIGSQHDARIAQGGRIRTEKYLFQGDMKQPDAEAFAALIRQEAEVTGVLVVSARPDPEPELTQTAYRELIGAQDRVLGSVQEILPGVPVLATCPDPVMPGNLRGGKHLSIPSWLAVSHLAGEMTSGTTRTQGIVSSLDIAPTLAVLSGAPFEGSRGHVVEVQAAADSLAKALRFQETLIVSARAVYPAIAAYASYVVGLLLVGTLFCLWKSLRVYTWLRTAILWGLIAAIVAPVCTGLATITYPSSLITYIVAMLLLCTVMTVAHVVLGRWLSNKSEDAWLVTLYLSVGIVAVFILSDTFSHNQALRLSPLDSFFLMPIRFYGLGNTYAAVLLTAAIWTGFLSVQRTGLSPLPLGGAAGLGAWFLACCVVVGWPSAGANLGALLTFLAACSVAWWLAARRSGIRWAWLYPMVASFALLAAVLWQETHSTQATHIGQFAATGSAGRSQILLTKLRMNLFLLTQPAAVLAYVLTLLYTSLWLRPLASLRRRILSRYPWLGFVFPSICTGAVTGLVLNDTGATMLIVMGAGFAVPWLFIALIPRGLSVVPVDRAHIE